MFMARVLRSSKIAAGSHSFHPMPQLSDGATRYEKCLRKRLEAFPPNELDTIKIKTRKTLENFHHKLRYDAESVFWLLLWWSIQAKP
jgi:hypothetical protein